MGNYTPDEVSREASGLEAHGYVIGPAMLRAYAATLRQQAFSQFANPEALADWLDALHECHADGSVGNRKWEAAQVAARAIRSLNEPSGNSGQLRQQAGRVDEGARVLLQEARDQIHSLAGGFVRADQLIARIDAALSAQPAPGAAGTGPLSERLRAGIECAPWVLAEVQKLEAKLAAQPAQGEDFEAWFSRQDCRTEWPELVRLAYHAHPAAPVGVPDGWVREARGIVNEAGTPRQALQAAFVRGSDRPDGEGWQPVALLAAAPSAPQGEG